ncbi:MAG TPA: helix-turn-helix domain-containing protein [Aeromicrobium sp.]|nr:helix-turn-helix domain-containing protein [Aeromicrobium sp.]
MAAKPERLLGLVRSSEHALDADASRGEVLDGALDAFLDLGVRRTSMGDIARRTGISPATLYRRFASKSAVVRAVGTREIRRFLADVDDLLAELDAQGTDVETLLTELGLAVIDGIRRNKLLQRLLRTEPEIVLPLLTVNGGPVIALGRDYLTDFIHGLQRQGRLPSYDAAPIAEVMARLAVSFALTEESVIALDDPDAARANVRSFLVPAITQAGT